MAMSSWMSISEHEVQLDQEVVRYLKSRKKVVEDISKEHGITYRYAEEHGTSTLIFAGNGDYIDSAIRAINQNVETFSISSFSLPGSALQTIKSIKHAAVIARFRENKVWAGWNIDPEVGKIHICSDTENNVNKAYQVLTQMLGATGVSAATSGSPFLPQSPQNRVVHEGYSTEILRYLRARGVMWSLKKSHDVEIIINVDDGFLTIEGALREVEGAKAEARRIVNSLSCESVILSEEACMRLLSIKPNDVVAEFKTLNLRIGWNVSDKQLCLCSDSRSNTRAGLNVLLTLIESDTKTPPTSPSSHGIPAGTFNDRLELEMEKLRYLKTTTLVNDFKREFKVELNINLSSCSVDFIGHKRDVFRGIEKLHTMAESHSVQPFDKSVVFCQCLEKVQNREVISALRSGQVTAGWSLREDKLWVCSDTKQNVAKAESAISGIVVESSYPSSGTPLSTTQKKAIATDSEWEVLISALKSRIPCFVWQFDEVSSKILFALPSTGNKLSVLHDFEKFFGPQIMQTKTIQLKTSNIGSLFSNNKEEIERRCRDIEPVIIKIVDRTVTVSSMSKESIDYAVKQLKKLQKDIATGNIDEEKIALMHWLTSSSGKSRVSQVASIYHTVYNISKPQPGQQPPMTTRRRSNADKMDVVSGDITDILLQGKADGILFNTGTVSEAIKRATRQGDHVNGFQSLVLKTGWALYAYHAKVYNWAGPSSLRDLKANVGAALSSFSQQGLKHILLPAIGTGKLGYPVADVADMMLTTTLEYLDTNPQTSIAQVDFVVYQKDSIYQAFSGKLAVMRLTASSVPIPSPKHDVKSRVSVTFTGLSQAAVDDSVAALQAEMDTLLITERWTNSPHRSAISKLSKKQISEITKDGARRNVEVIVDPSAKDIIIRGFKDEIQGSRDLINRLLYELAEHGTPSHWTRTGDGKYPLEVTLNPRSDSKECSKVHKLFSQANVQITEIRRIQNAELHTQYEAQKSRVQRELAGTGVTVERSLWHGTDGESMRKICQQEFNRSFCGKNGVAFGQGVYFSTSSQYSMGYSRDLRDKYMILAKVVTGRYKLGSSSTTRRTLPGEYHSTVNDESSPSIFVVYHDAAAYPEYVIKFTG